MNALSFVKDTFLDFYAKYEKCLELVDEGNANEVLIELVQMRTHLSEKDQFFADIVILELYLAWKLSNSADISDTVENLSKMNDLNGTSMAGTLDMDVVAMKLIAQDLSSDYQFLKEKGKSKLNLLWLVNKKLALVSSIPEDVSEKLIKVCLQLYLKLVQVFLLSGAHFSKQHMSCMILEKMLLLESKANGLSLSDDSLCDMSTKKIFLMFSAGEFVSYSQFQRFLDSPKITYISKYFTLKDIQLNFIENSISNLSKYYKILKLEKILNLIEVSDIPELDIEEFVLKMILESKLPEGARIDQSTKSICFLSSESLYDSTNIRMKEVRALIDTISAIFSDEANI